MNPRGSEYFSFQISDKALLQEIRKTLASNHKLAVRFPRKANEATQYRLQIGSKNMCADLRDLGIRTDKAKTMKIPPVPVKLLKHFIRGYFDGDGNVWSGEIHRERRTSHTVLMVGFTSCSKNFLKDLFEKLKEEGLIGGGIYCKKNAFCIKYSTSDSQILYDFMYRGLGDSKLFLSRKKKIFEKFIKNCGGSSTG